VWQQEMDEADSFAYFESHGGRKFLAERGESPQKPGSVSEATPSKGKSKTSPKPPRAPAAQTTKRSPWNPRLVGEEAEEEGLRPGLGEEAGYEEELEEVRELPGASLGGTQSFRETATRFASGGYPGAQEEEEEGYAASGYGRYGGGGGGLAAHPADRPSIMPEHSADPAGPHPDKKGVKWDHRGELRPPKPRVAQAYVEINHDYLETEGATDRRVRTSSIAHKKNAAKAPNVSAVRKEGQHAVGRTANLSAKDLVGDIAQAGGSGERRHMAEEHWKLTSTMQGLGDSNNLVEVMPGSCRFGPLCLGNIYRMSFFVRNLDVDVTRYLITSCSDYVKICHTPGELVGNANKIAGQIAPGMAKRVVVEIAAHTPVKIDQFIEVAVKAHKIKVLVTARAMDVEEYEKDDSTEVALHGRHIGRSRQRNDPAAGGKPPVVEQVADSEYCRQVFKRLGKEGIANILPPIGGDVSHY